MRKLLLLIGGLLLVWSCDTSEIPVNPEKLGYIYFPLEIGQYTIYDVEETTYSLTAPPAILNYQVKEVVTDTFTALSGDKAFQIYRFIREDEQASWGSTPDSVWTAKRNASQAIRTESNVAFVKLIFPVKAKVSWNGNALNDRGRDDYAIEDFGKPFQVLGNTFENTVTVIQQNDSNLVNNDRRIEVFAPHVGLIYKERYQVQYCGASSGSVCTSVGQIDFGIKYIQRIREYGKE